MSKRADDSYFKQIIARRDRRFDGRFYFGVRTTGIYCRPICPAKPKSENIILFKSSSEAETAGYRACRRCHPDLAPSRQFRDDERDVVWKALRLLQSHDPVPRRVDQLARSLGITDRHLRRLFQAQLGASPIEIVITQRLHLAKQMLQETTASVTEIALAVGFQSLRRFNEAFKDRYGKSPSGFRRAQESEPKDPLRLRLPIHLPYDWPTVIGYLERHETYGIERIHNGTYRRFIRLDGRVGSVRVSYRPNEAFLSVDFFDIPLRHIRWSLARLKALFDTDHNPVHLPQAKGISSDGVRVPGSFDPFETAVSVILSQLVSGAQAKAVLRKLVERFGHRIGHDDGREIYTFPSPKILAKARIELIGIPKSRAQAIRELASVVDREQLRFDWPTDFAEVEKQLLSLHGIGPWTASMIAMRCLGNPDAFPALDLIVRRAIDQKLVDQEQWMSSRAYLTHCLWRDFSQTLSKAKRRHS